MKTFKLFVFCLLLSSASAFSQYNNNSYNPYSITHYGGVNRDIPGAGRDDGAPKKPTAEEVDKLRNESIDKFMVKLKADLTLDELQFIAIKNELVSNSKKVDIVMKKEENDPEGRSKEVKALMDKTEATIKSYLSKGQKEKYDLFIAEMTKKNKGKKDKNKGEEKELPDLDQN